MFAWAKIKAFICFPFILRVWNFGHGSICLNEQSTTETEVKETKICLREKKASEGIFPGDRKPAEISFENLSRETQCLCND